MAAKPKPRMIGRYIVADPAVCHGQPTFRGTRILVADVLEQVSAGMAWESIALEWRERVSKEAIAEAVRLASQAFQDHAGRYVAAEYVLQPLRSDRVCVCIGDLRSSQTCSLVQIQSGFQSISEVFHEVWR